MGLFSKKTLLESNVKCLRNAFIYQFIYEFLENPYSNDDRALKIDRLAIVFDNSIDWKKGNEYYITFRNCGSCANDDAYLIISENKKKSIDIHVLMKGISKKNMSQLEDDYDQYLRQCATSLYYHPATTGFYFKKRNVYSGHDMKEYLKNGGHLIYAIVEASKNEDSLKDFYEKKLELLQNNWQKQAYKVIINSIYTKSFDLLDTEIYKYITLDEFKELESSIFSGVGIKIHNSRKKRFLKR